MSVSIQKEDFDVSGELLNLREKKNHIGAIVSFIGTVRDISGQSRILRLELEHYPAMTEKTLAEIESQAFKRWDILGCRIVHRVGILEPSEQIVLVAVASAHRSEAFAACEFIIDSLKTKAPFWKREETEEGRYWVDEKEADRQSAKRWQT